MVTVLILVNATPVLVSVPDMYGMKVLVRVWEVTLGTMLLHCVRLLTDEVMMPESSLWLCMTVVVALL